MKSRTSDVRLCFAAAAWDQVRSRPDEPGESSSGFTHPHGFGATWRGGVRCFAPAHIRCWSTSSSNCAAFNLKKFHYSATTNQEAASCNCTQSNLHLFSCFLFFILRGGFALQSHKSKTLRSISHGKWKQNDKQKQRTQSWSVQLKIK